LAALAGFAVILAVLAVVFLLQSRETQREAEDARTLADNRRQEAEKAEAHAKAAQTLADEQRAQAKQQAQAASESRGLALKPLKDVVFDTHAGLQNRPQMQALQKKLLQKALPGLERGAHSAETSKEASHGMVWAYLELGDAFLLLGQTAEARKYCEKGQQLAQQLAAADPGNAQGPTRPSLLLQQTWPAPARPRRR
jgi:hypothetical protein